MKAKPTCEACSFFAQDEDPRDGVCRRHAPRPVSSAINAVWPTVFASAWCGEWRPEARGMPSGYFPADKCAHGVPAGEPCARCAGGTTKDE